MRLVGARSFVVRSSSTATSSNCGKFLRAFIYQAKESKVLLVARVMTSGKVKTMGDWIIRSEALRVFVNRDYG